MDPFMERNLRLAERQGLMWGPDISVVQGEGLALLEYQDQIEKSKNDYEAFKRALLARAEYDPSKIYPDYFPTPEVDDDNDGDDVEYDYSAVEWKGPSDTDQEELDRILKVIAGAASGGTVNLGDTGLVGDGKWV